MDILILHLSDIHFNINSPTNHFDKILNSLNAFGKVAYVIFLITGDISQSGNSTQFSLFNAIFSDFISKIKSKKQVEVKVYCVPGNHDISHHNKNSYKRYS